MTRQLSYSQARRCELAIGKTCKCRCGGLLHGALRGSKDELETDTFFNELDELDPHHIDTKEQKKARRDKWLEIMNELLNKQILKHGALYFTTNIDDKLGIFECIFCKCFYKLPIFDTISKSNYRNGWLHQCERAKLVTTEYNTYKSMISRCYNKDDPQYKNFGAKGVIVCISWKDAFENFLYDLGFKPSSNVRLARKDRKVGYNLDNCYWYDEIDKKKIEGLLAYMLHKLYRFNDEWFKFWLVEYDYGRPSKVVRTEEFQAPMTVLNGDMTFSRIVQCPEMMANKWIAKFGEKFGYQHAVKIDNGHSEYIEQSLLPLQPTSTNG